MDLAKTPLLTASPRRFNAAGFLLGLVLRLAFTAVCLAKGLAGLGVTRDLYYNMALTWLGWSAPYPFDATHPPLYTALIAAVLGIFRSPNPLPVLLLQCALGALCVPMTYQLGKRLSNEKTARFAALWVALDPGLIFFTPQLGTETMFIAMELALFIGLLDALKRPLSVRLVGLGLWGGLTALCRSVIGGYPAFLFLVLWRARGLVRAFLFCAILGVGWLAPTIGWKVRNRVKYGKWVPMASVMGWNLYEGFTLDREEVRRRPIDMGKEADILGIHDDPIACGDHFARKTMAFMRAQPLAAARIIGGKALLFWRPWPYAPHSWWQRSVLGIYFTLLFALALVGVRVAWQDTAWAPIWALFAYLTALHSVFFTSLRYRLPLEPFLCLLAAMGALELLRRKAARRA